MRHGVGTSGPSLDARRARFLDEVRWSIYLIKNEVTGACYVGQAKRDVFRRWSQHVAHAKCDAAAGRVLTRFQADLVLHGCEAFSIRTLEEVGCQEEADASEARWIAKLGACENGLNSNGGRSCKRPRSRKGEQT